MPQNRLIEKEGVMRKKKSKEKEGTPKITSKPGMCLKTKEEKIDIQVSPTMLLKKSVLWVLSEDVIEKK